MERNYKLYVHIAPNGKKYYGITKQRPKRRWQNGKGYKGNQYFTRTIEKYGWDNIEHIVLQEGLDEEEAKELEQYMIQWYNTTNPNYGYNITLGGEGSNGYICTEEHKQKISKANKGKNHTEESKRKISEANKGHIHTEEAKYKMSKATKGRKLSEEHKQKLSEANKGKTGKLHPKSKPVMCITTNQLYYSASEAERMTGTLQRNISSCCNSKRKSAGKSPTGEKLVWKYIDIIEL